VLKEEPLAKVAIPSVEEIQEYQAVVRDNFPALDGAWCVMDGLKIPIQRSGDELAQNAYYNGWSHAHFVGCVMAFAPSGIIVACTLNAPGSWHDSFIAQNGGLYDQLKAVFNTAGGKGVVDSAFSKKHCPFLIKSGNHKPGETALETMRAVEGSFPQLKDKLLLSDIIEDRNVFLYAITMLHNFRTHRVGLNQLSSTYYPVFVNVGDNVLDMFA
jgi:hypothetical protein